MLVYILVLLDVHVLDRVGVTYVRDHFSEKVERKHWVLRCVELWVTLSSSLLCKLFQAIGEKCRLYLFLDRHEVLGTQRREVANEKLLVTRKASDALSRQPRQLRLNLQMQLDHLSNIDD